jgi:hypothetical protein
MQKSRVLINNEVLGFAKYFTYTDMMKEGGVWIPLYVSSFYCRVELADDNQSC